MKRLVLVLLLVISTSALADVWPNSPFTFVGVPEKIEDNIFEGVEGRLQRIRIRIVMVTSGTYNEKVIWFGYSNASKPPLEIGETYTFAAIYDRHGIRYTSWEKIKK